MKKMMLMITLVGLSAARSYAQNEKYICTEKVVHNNIIPIIDVEPTTGNFVYYSQDTETKTVTLVSAGKLVPAFAPLESCYKENQNGMMITKCPGVTYKSDGKNVFEYNSEGAYLGYYPVQPTVTETVGDDNMTCVKVVPEPAPVHVIYKMAIPANASPSKDCTPR